MTEIRTKTGKVLTDADFEALADEAERGYDVKAEDLRPVEHCEHGLNPKMCPNHVATPRR